MVVPRVTRLSLTLPGPYGTQTLVNMPHSAGQQATRFSQSSISEVSQIRSTLTFTPTLETVQVAQRMVMATRYVRMHTPTR